jgi:Mrp family chromosome partitioning ATPase
MGHSSIKCLAVTSCLRRDGRSTIAAGLALTHAYEYRRRTILVDLDLERPSLAERFGLQEAPGVAELLRDEVTLQPCLHQLGENLTVVTAGASASESTHLLREAPTARILDLLEESSDVVVADLPPLTPGSGAVQLADLCSTVALVVRSGTVGRDEVAEAVGCLTGPVYGIVNDVRPSTPRLLRRLLGLER